ncbi:hypothetical protein GEMRC1_012267 [Eukaryota sp. GEM-RC1]
MTANRFVAIKSMKKSHLVKLKQLSHVLNEKRILTSIHHPFIVNCLGTYQDPYLIHVVMEFVNGGELFLYLRKQKRFPLETSKFYAAQLVLALDHLHKHGICYRDLKPENLLLDSQGYLKICDFGFMKIVNDRTWTLCGTPEYLAPEIILHKGHNHSVDWWALGILIYEMLAGYPPYTGKTPYAIYESILSNKLSFPRHVDPVTRDLIKRLLTQDKSRRLGNLRNGVRDIMNHKFFRGIDWNAVITKTIPAPILPRVTGPGDDHLFENYGEPEEDLETDLPAEVQKFFEDF